MNGANIDNGRYFPQTSSYDYDAALDESGRVTPKFQAFRDLIAAHTKVTPPDIPAVPAPISIPAIALSRTATLWETLGRGQRVERPRPMEAFGQSYGYILYRTHLTGPLKGTLKIRDVRDYAQIYVNRALVGTLDRRLSQDTLAIDVPAGTAALDILVENLGRVNFNKPIREERKGITTSVTLDDRELTAWEVFPLPMSTMPMPKRETIAGGDGAGVLPRQLHPLDHRPTRSSTPAAGAKALSSSTATISDASGPSARSRRSTFPARGSAKAPTTSSSSPSTRREDDDDGPRVARPE